MSTKIKRSQIQFLGIATPAGDPPAGEFFLYFKADGLLYKKDDTGTETAIEDTLTSETGITAFATGGQANATLLTKDRNKITIIAADGDSVKTPPAIEGDLIVVQNSDAAESLDLFPAVGETIDDQAVNLAIAIAPGSFVSMFCYADGAWDLN